VALNDATTKKKFTLPSGGLYVITDGSTGPVLYARVRACLGGGAKLFQYRAKNIASDVQHRDASALRKLTIAAGAGLIINDDVALCLAVGADGVHLGRNDACVSMARETLGAKAIVGASCYDQPERAHQALSDGADYVAFGAIRPSISKPGAPGVSAAVLSQAVREISAPVVAIGGIDLATATHLWERGIRFCAVIHDLFSCKDIEARVARYQQLFTRHFRPYSTAWDNEAGQE